MKTIYLTGHNNFDNRGCEAIVRSTIRLLNQHDETIKFFVPSNNLKRDIKKWPNAKKHGVIFVNYKIPFFLKVLWKIQKIFKLNNLDILNYYPKYLLSIYEKVDLFIEKMEVTYPISYDPNGKIFSDFTIEGAGVTRNIVVDKNGKIVFLTRLYEEKEFNSMIQIIKTLL